MSGAGATQPLRVMVADDDPDIQAIIVTALEKGGFLVTGAKDGADALALAAVRQPDVAMIDLHMPRVDGFEVIRQLKAALPTRPVIALSGDSSLESRCAAFDAGADDFVSKPFYLRELLMRVEAHARNHRKSRELERLGAHADHLRVLTSEASALLAHDLNNGLAVVKANLEYLTDSMQAALAADEESADAASGAKRALARMVTLVRNFVDIARMEDAVLKPARAVTSIAEIVAQVAEIHRPRRTASALDLVIDVAPTLRAEIDPVLLERILHNLLNNSMRYVSRNGSVRVAARIERGERGDVLALSVGNTGPAIPDAIRGGLFDKYTKGADKKAQSGMGLYFCRLASEAHGGDIRLIDDPPYTTCFVVRLALLERAEEPRPAPQRPALERRSGAI